METVSVLLVVLPGAKFFGSLVRQYCLGRVWWWIVVPCEVCAGIWGVSANVRPLMRTSMSCAMTVEVVLDCEGYGDPGDGCSGALILLRLLVDVFANVFHGAHGVLQLLLGRVSIYSWLINFNINRRAYKGYNSSSINVVTVNFFFFFFEKHNITIKYKGNTTEQKKQKYMSGCVTGQYFMKKGK